MSDFSWFPVFIERELAFAIRCRSSVCRLSVRNVHAPYILSRLKFSAMFLRHLVLSPRHPMTSTENFTEIVPGEPLRLGS